MAYTCTTCGAVADKANDICNPTDDVSKNAFCGQHTIDVKHVCTDNLRKMQYVCNGCGRVAMEKEHLCNPDFIDS